ncbi:MAG: hypothetical protein JWN65_1585 [Solirubrobacterales bacterium]|nr:hypothetical protein [Solirubrobacterales bacterium]
MTAWLVGAVARRAPRRLVLAAIGIAFPVAMLAATLLFIDSAAHSMTRVALGPVQIELKALATSLNGDMAKTSAGFATVPGVQRAERFAAADVVVSALGTSSRSTARVFAVDPAYLAHHPFARVLRGDLRSGALLNPALHGVPGFAAARRVQLEIPGQGRPIALTLPVGGLVDLTDATSWFQIPTGSVQGDVAVVPRSIVIDYPTFEHRVLPALRSRFGPTTPVLNPDLADLPPVTLESHVTVAHDSYPSDPGAAAAWSSRLRRVLDRQAPGAVVVADNALETLTEAQVDAADAKILFLLLGIPGVLVAGALGLAAESAVAEAHRREDALLRLRGATEGQLARFASASGVVAAATGIVLGLLAAAAGVSAVIGHAAWRDASTGRLLVTALLAAAAGVLTMVVRLARLVRAGRRADVVAQRQVLEAGWQPRWLRSHVDLAAIGVGLAILLVNLLGGGLKQTPVQGPSVALSFYVLLAPLALWLGLTLLAVRGALALSARRVRPERSRPLRSWRGAALCWLGRRPARAAVTLVLGTLAVAFATEVVTFVATYRAAKQADTHAAFGSSLRVTPLPSDLPPTLPALGPHVAAATPIRYIGVRAGTDRKTMLTVEPSTYEAGTAVAPRILAGHGFASLAADPRGVLIAKELATDFELKPGDPLPLTVFPDDEEKRRNVTMHVDGVFRSFPPDAPLAELVATSRSFRPFLLPAPEFYLARTIAGHPAASVADELRHAGVGRTFAIATTADTARASRRTLATLNLTGLSRIESLGAGLIAAVGVALLGAFVVLERRREFAILRAVGADTGQLLTGPAQEGSISVLGSILLGIPIGLGLGALAVRVLALFFTLPPPVAVLPIASLARFVLLVVVTCAIALAAALFAVTRVSAAQVLREP